MKTALHALISIVLLLSSLRVIAQQQPSPPKTIPDSINLKTQPHKQVPERNRKYIMNINFSAAC